MVPNPIDITNQIQITPRGMWVVCTGAADGTSIPVRMYKSPLVRVENQEAARNCIANSLLNILPQSEPVTPRLHAVAPYGMGSLPEAIKIMGQWGFQFTHVGGCDLLRQILASTSGKFIIRFENHCLSVDMGENVVFETDPSVRWTLPATRETFAALGYHRATVAYQFTYATRVNCKRKRDARNRKRQRKRQRKRDRLQLSPE